MKNKKKILKLNDKEYNDYIKSIVKGEKVEVPEITEIKKD